MDLGNESRDFSHGTDRHFKFYGDKNEMKYPCNCNTIKTSFLLAFWGSCEVMC